MNRIPSSYLSALVDLAQQQNVSETELFHPADLVHGHLSVEEARIDEISFNQAVTILKARSGQYPLMLELGKLLAINLSEPYLQGAGGEALNVRDAVVAEFCGKNPLLDFSLQDRGELTHLALMAVQMVDAEVVEFKLAALYQFIACLSESELGAVRIDFSHTVPVYGAETHTAFAAELGFSRIYNELKVSSEVLAQALPGCVLQSGQGDPAIDRLRDQCPLIRQTLDFIESNVTKVPLKIEDAAIEFNMSPRTLQRHLKKYEVTFVQLRDCVKKHHSLQMLQDQHLNLAAISDQLGFADVSGFHHAFKRWTGQSPKEYRQQIFV